MVIIIKKPQDSLCQLSMHNLLQRPPNTNFWNSSTTQAHHLSQCFHISMLWPVLRTSDELRFCQVNISVNNTSCQHTHTVVALSKVTSSPQCCADNKRWCQHRMESRRSLSFILQVRNVYHHITRTYHLKHNFSDEIFIVGEGIWDVTSYRKCTTFFQMSFWGAGQYLRCKSLAKQLHPRSLSYLTINLWYKKNILKWQYYSRSLQRPFPHVWCNEDQDFF